MGVKAISILLRPYIITELIDIITATGIPTAKILFIISARGLISAIFSFISLFREMFSTKASAAAVHWLMTVATAAPFIPIAGSPSQPKMSIGSRMMLRTAPQHCVIIDKCVFPVDWSSLSNVTCPASPNENIVTMLRYSVP